MLAHDLMKFDLPPAQVSSKRISVPPSFNLNTNHNESTSSELQVANS